MSELRIDLDAFAANLARIRAVVAPAEHMLVVKDDAYAQGVERIVQRAWQEGVHWFGAYEVGNATRVRGVLGSDARVFVWMLRGVDDVRRAVAARLDLGIGTEQLLEDVASAVADDDVAVRVHLKIDTGLHRNGVRPERWSAFVTRAAELERAGRIEVVGVWSHIAEASDVEDDDARAVFDAAVATARAAGLAVPLRHLAASAAAFARPEFRYDMVRVGAFAYGVRPAGGPGDDALGITPVASLVAQVADADDETVRLDLGSAGGLPSILRGAEIVTPGGRRVVHDITLRDMTVDGWPGAQPGDEVVVFGASGVSATDLAERIDTIGEEILLRVSPRIPRRYT